MSEVDAKIAGAKIIGGLCVVLCLMIGTVVLWQPPLRFTLGDDDCVIMDYQEDDAPGPYFYEDVTDPTIFHCI